MAINDLSLIDDAKATNRVTTDDEGIRQEITDLIETAMLDLEITGVDAAKINVIPIDPLIKRAVLLYVKANFGFDNPDAERLQRNYEMLRDKLSMDIDYMAVTV